MALSVFTNVMTMLVYMAVGYILCKSKLGDPSHGRTMSGLLIYILGPAMIINSFLTTEYSLETLKNIGIFFLVSLAVQMLFFAVLIAVFHKKYSDAKYRILTTASVLGNVGFFGLPVLVGIFPNDPIVACYSSINVMSMNLLVFTIGSFLITGDKKFVSIRGIILNPTTVAVAIALPIFILKIQLPSAVTSGIGLLGKMVTPICMIVLGMRLSTIRFRDLFSRPFVYVTCLLKLIVFPLFAYGVACLLPFADDIFKISIFVLAAAPTGAVVQSIAELQGTEQELTANVVLLTTILSVITIPLVVSIL